MRRAPIAVLLFVAALFLPLLVAQDSGRGATLINKDNRVEISRGGGGGWGAASVGQTLSVGDRLRTGEDSRAVVRMADGSVLQLDELTTIEIKTNALGLPQGAAFFFSRGKSREMRIETPAANGAIRGTAFVIKINSAQTVVSMINGEFALSNGGGAVTAQQGQRADASVGGAPRRGTLSDLGNSAPWYLVLENHLGNLQPLRDANRTQFFSALPNSIKQYRLVAPQLSGAATIARTAWALDILRESFNAVGPDCAMRARILRSVIAADPKDAAKLLELAIQLGPDCAGAFSKSKGPGLGGGEDEGVFGNPTGNNIFGNPPGSLGGGGQGNIVAVCHNGQTIFLSPEDAQRDLKQNPGDKLGACQVTPVANP